MDGVSGACSRSGSGGGGVELVVLVRSGVLAPGDGEL